MKALGCATVLLILTAGALASSWRHGGTYIRLSPGQGQDQDYHQGHEHQGHGSRSSRWRWETGQSVLNFDDPLRFLLGLNQRTTPRPVTPREVLPVPYSGEWVRLRAIPGHSQAGVLEVYRAARWGIVCDDSWDLQDAAVACRQLGFKDGAESTVGEGFSETIPNRWTRDDIVMDEVNCDGSESQLQFCDYSPTHDCQASEAVAVTCKPNPGCPEGWVSSSQSCYKFLPKTARDVDDAEAQCAGLNASLLAVDSLQENHFLSNALSLTWAREDSVWYTSGRRSKQEWRWTKPTPGAETKTKKDKTRLDKKGKSKDKNRVDKKEKIKDKSRLDKKGKTKDKSRQDKKEKIKDKSRADKKEKTKKDNSQQRRDRRRRRPRDVSRRARGGDPLGMRGNQPASADFSRWFPGWLPAGEGQEPSSRKGHDCLVLTDRYSLTNGTTVSVDYFYWKAEPCTGDAPISFICQTPVSGRSSPYSECYQANGEDYRGTLSYTDSGTPCIPWTESRSTIFPHLGLGEHNYCRNPDGDSRPWCWVDYNDFGYCPVPPCSGTTSAPSVHSTTAMEPSTMNCPADQFFCQQDNKCVTALFRCDGEKDCGDGADETGCVYNLEKFDMHNARVPRQTLFNLTYINTALETCATLCLKSTVVSCVSFLYVDEERLCTILNSTGRLRPQLVASVEQDFYFLRTAAVASCRGAFQCSNAICVEAEQQCNGRDDCGDFSDELGCEVKPVEVKVRLADGGEHSGRVEVFYQGEWGTVCDDSWDLMDGHVVCRMLGYQKASRVYFIGEFGPGKGNILLDDVQCRGNETSLADCPSSPWKQHDCQPIEAAGVACQVGKVCEPNQFVCKRTANTTYPECLEASRVCDSVIQCSDASDESSCIIRVELLNGTAPNEGRVEVIRNGLRGTVCDDDWGPEDADVVCRMLGYRDGGTAVSGAHFGPGSGLLIWLDNVVCSGSELSLGDCQHAGWAVSDCSRLEDAGVRCHVSRPTLAASTPTTTIITTTVVTPAPTLVPLSVRVHLVNGSVAYEGRVELEIADTRGTICDDDFDNKDATVVCKMAGYPLGGIALNGGTFGPGSPLLDILLDELKCNGSEVDVLQCSHRPLKTHDCVHTEDAAVHCLLSAPTDLSTTRPPTNSSDGEECGLRPLEDALLRLHGRRRRRQALVASAQMNSTEPRRLGNPPRIQKIVGGDTAQHGLYPWQVGVNKIYNIYDNGEITVGPWCGGTIINKFWVLSAAHCFTSLPKSRVSVVVGDHGFKSADKGEQRFFVEELILHHGYKSATHDNDIALLKIKSEDGQGMKLDDYVQPACLPRSHTAYRPGLRCLISGWGEIGNDQTTSYLRAAEVPLISDHVCNLLYRGKLTRSMLCAGYLEGRVDTCQGDSGGPLVCKVDGKYTVLGVTSWGFGCAQPDSPGIYTKTQEFLAWIEDTLRIYS